MIWLVSALSFIVAGLAAFITLWTRNNLLWQDEAITFMKRLEVRLDYLEGGISDQERDTWLGRLHTDNLRRYDYGKKASKKGHT
jgi:hypothetical protein